MKGCALWENEAMGPALGHLEPHRPGAPHLPGLCLLVCSVWQKEVPASAFTGVLSTEKSTVTRKAVLALGTQYTWDLFLHAIPNRECLDCKVLLQVISLHFSVSWKYVDTQDCNRAIATEDNQCQKGSSWYRSIHENTVA